MKRKLLFTGLLAMAASQFHANAQVWSENFNNGMPATWILHNVDGLTPYPSTAFVTDAWVTRIKTDAAGTPIAGDSVLTSTSWYSPAGTSNDWVVTHPFMVTDVNTVIKWDALASNATYTDGYEVRVSPTGGSNVADFTDIIFSTAAATTGEYGTRGAALGTYNGQNIRIAFRNNSNDKELLNIDNVQVLVASAANDVSVDKIILPRLSSTDLAAANGTTVQAIITNKGGQKITSVDLTYKIDGGAATTQTFTGLNIAPYNPETVTFTTTLSGIAAGAHTITVEATQVNGGVDGNTADNIATQNFTGASKAATRAALIEEFSSSTCVPCASFNSTFDPFVESIGVNTTAANFNIIKYQMNWPSPNNDSSYNAHGATRQGYYGVNSIPDHFTNGMPGGNGDQAEIDKAKATPSFMDISGTFTVSNDSMYANVSVTPYFTVSGNYKVYVAVVEKDYYNPYATTTQNHYIHVMRRMYPSGDGVTVNNWVDNTPQNYNYKSKYTVGHPRQGNYNFWTHPKNANLVVFVQDDASKEILQSKVIYAQWPTGVKEMNGIGKAFVFPNPASDAATVSFDLQQTTDMQVQVVDGMGKVIYNQMYKNMKAGVQEVNIPTAGFPNGLYYIRLHSEYGNITERLSVIK